MKRCSQRNLLQGDDVADLEEDLRVLECLQRFRDEFIGDITSLSKCQDVKVIAALQLEAIQPFAEFFFSLRARGIASESDLERAANAHNNYIVGLAKNPLKAEQLGLRNERLIRAMFTGDTLPRLLRTWGEHPGSIDQSNLGRFLAAAMSAETARKLAMACSKAGFLERSRSPSGTVIVKSTGILEELYWRCLRRLRLAVQNCGTAGVY
jgi:hypothetical protein